MNLQSSGLSTSEYREGEQSCELCGATKPYVFKNASPLRCATAVCLGCGLIQAWPRLSPADLDLVNLHNPGDPGSLVNARSGTPSEKNILREEARASKSIKVIQRFIDLKAKRVLSLRCRSGALAVLLRQEGANELSIDPQEASINYGQKVRGLSDFHTVPMSQFDKLDFLSDSSFDVIEGLSDHVAAHVLSVRGFLERLFDRLKPGGYLFIDEKDILTPSRKLRCVLDTGQAHQYHLTIPTFTALIRSVGFEIIHCALNPDYITDFRHFNVVARKPIDRYNKPKFVFQGPNGREVIRQLRKLELDWWLSQYPHEVAANTINALRRLPGVRPMWRLAKRMIG